MRKWRRGSEFGDGRRVPLDREQRAVWRARLGMKAFRGPGKLTANAIALGHRLLAMLGQDGALFPSIDTLADRQGIAPSTVTLALKRLRQLGFLSWQRRLARCGGRVWQASNAYALHLACCDDVIRQGVKTVVFSVQEPTRLGDEEARENATRQLAALGAVAGETSRRREVVCRAFEKSRRRDLVALKLAAGGKLWPGG